MTPTNLHDASAVSTGNGVQLAKIPPPPVYQDELKKEPTSKEVSPTFQGGEPLRLGADIIESDLYPPPSNSDLREMSDAASKKSSLEQEPQDDAVNSDVPIVTTSYGGDLETIIKPGEPVALINNKIDNPDIPGVDEDAKERNGIEEQNLKQDFGFETVDHNTKEDLDKHLPKDSLYEESLTKESLPLENQSHGADDDDNVNMNVISSLPNDHDIITGSTQKGEVALNGNATNAEIAKDEGMRGVEEEQQQGLQVPNKDPLQIPSENEITSSNDDSKYQNEPGEDDMSKTRPFENEDQVFVGDDKKDGPEEKYLNQVSTETTASYHRMAHQSSCEPISDDQQNDSGDMPTDQSGKGEHEEVERRMNGGDDDGDSREIEYVNQVSNETTLSDGHAKRRENREEEEHDGAYDDKKDEPLASKDHKDASNPHYLDHGDETDDKDQAHSNDTACSSDHMQTPTLLSNPTALHDENHNGIDDMSSNAPANALDQNVDPQTSTCESMDELGQLKSKVSDDKHCNAQPIV